MSTWGSTLPLKAMRRSRGWSRPVWSSPLPGPGSPGVLTGPGVTPASRRTLFRSLVRRIERNRGQRIAASAPARATTAGDLSLCL